MNKLDHLPEYTDRVFHGLRADNSLKQRILQEAVSSRDASSRPFSFGFRPGPVLCSIAAVMLIVLTVIGSRVAIPAAPEPGKIVSFAAGKQGSSAAPESVFLIRLEDLDPGKVLSMEIPGLGKVTDPENCAELTRILQNESVPAASAETTAYSDSLIITTGERTIQIKIQAPFLSMEKSLENHHFFEQFSEMTAE